jgi:ribosome biogenesis ATPase
LSLEKTGGKMVCVIGATNRPDSLDAGLRRAGRFDKEISIGMPDVDARFSILKKICEKLKLQGDFDFKKIAKLTPGFVGADIQALTTEAAGIAVNRIFEEKNISIKQDPLNETELSHLSILMKDFERAVKKVQPSAMREG